MNATHKTSPLAPFRSHDLRNMGGQKQAPTLRAFNQGQNCATKV